MAVQRHEILSLTSGNLQQNHFFFYKSNGFFKSVSFLSTDHLAQALYDSAVQYEATSDWAQAAEQWKACVNETLRQTGECRVQCEVASQRLPEDRGVNSVDGVFEKAAGKENTRNLDLFSSN